MKIDITNYSKTEKVASALNLYIQSTNKPQIFYLSGDLGSGKTTLVREILKSMGWKGTVKSPTFSILEEYEINERNIFHADLYRLNNENDFNMLGLELNENSNDIFFIEWPDRISKLGFGSEFFFELSVNKNTRSITMESDEPSFSSCIDRINIDNPI